jgi:hypothetical protein
MPSPLNAPLPAYASGASIGDALEHVLVTSPRVIVDDPQSVVVLHGLVDISIAADATAVTLYLERGSAIAGTKITQGGTWGPYPVTGPVQAQFAVSGYDLSPAAFDEVYVLTAILTANDAASTVNAAYLEAIVQAKT